jgi:hypothetical protein
VTWLTFVVASLATYRVALMLSQEEGPFGMFLWVRNRFTRDDWMGRGVRCLWCVSFWVGWLIALLVAWAGWGEYILVALGLSGASVILDRYWKR